jgi:hypothetical protein
LEAELYRPPLIPVLLRFTPEQLERLDQERRVPAYNGIPSRCATIRMLVDEALAHRRAARPRTSGPGRGEPFVFKS